MRLQGCTVLNGDFALERRDLGIENGKITLSGGGGETLDLSGMTVIPGLVDIHIHGYMGESTASSDRAGLTKMCRALLRAGTTSILPTVGSCADAELRASLSRLHELQSSGVEDGAELLGIYLEAP